MAQNLEISTTAVGDISEAADGFDGHGNIAPFRLVKYFSFTGFIVIFAFTLLLSLLITSQAKGILLKKSGESARLVTGNLNHQVFLQFVLPVARLYGRIRLEEEEQFKRMDAVVRNTIHGFKIHRVNIYNLEGQVIYSTQQRLTEKSGQKSEPYEAAIKGDSTSDLITYPGRVGGFRQVRMLRTFSPFRAEKPIVGSVGYVMGVFEIYQDLSEDYTEIVNFQYISVAISLVFMVMLFFILRLIMKRADAIIDQRNNERRRLQEKLHQSEKLAGLGQMIAAVSHEIRNPLGIISSSAEILKNKMLEYEPNNQLSAVLVEESQRLNRIVTEFLDFARPQVPKFTPMSLGEILDKNLNFLSPEIERKGITINKRYGGPVSIEADPDLLYRAFLNIFLNAIQAMPDAGYIHVRTTGMNGGREHRAKVIISDTGIGLEPDVVSFIFNPFFTTKNKGSGLGLAIVKNIIDSHHGDITIEPMEGGGTRVVIELPVKQPPSS